MRMLGALLAGIGLLTPMPPSHFGGLLEDFPSRSDGRGKGRNKSPRRFSGVAAARRAARKARRAA